MVQKQASESRQQPRRASRREASPGDNIRDRIAGLRNLPREQLADAVFMLAMDAKRQSALLREAINRRAGVGTDSSATPGVDLATYLAEEAVSTLRCHDAGPPSFLDALVQRSREVRFTIDQNEAIALLAAMVWEQRTEGILEGLRLAGVLNAPSKDRHSNFRR